jgi:hypothetical protein
MHRRSCLVGFLAAACFVMAYHADAEHGTRASRPKGAEINGTAKVHDR